MVEKLLFDVNFVEELNKIIEQWEDGIFSNSKVRERVHKLVADDEII